MDTHFCNFLSSKKKEEKKRKGLGGGSISRRNPKPKFCDYFLLHMQIIKVSAFSRRTKIAGMI